MEQDSIVTQPHTRIGAGIAPAGLRMSPSSRKTKISLFPLLGTGNTVIEAVKVLIEHGVQPSVIILLSLFSTPHGKSRGCAGRQRCSCLCHPAGKASGSPALQAAAKSASLANKDTSSTLLRKDLFSSMNFETESEHWHMWHGQGRRLAEQKGPVTPHGKTATGEAFLSAGIGKENAATTLSLPVAPEHSSPC